MRLVTYNILLGGVFPEGNDRLETILGVLGAENPDIVTLQEANNFDMAKRELFASRLGLPYHSLAYGTKRSSGNRYNVATFSRYPIDFARPVPGTFHHAALQTLIDSPLGPIAVTNVHLGAGPAEQGPELEAVLKVQEPFPTTILCGDFNSLSVEDEYDPDLPQRFNEALLTFYTSGGRLHFDITGKAKERGYVDAALARRANRPTFPTLIKYPDGLHFRIDYVFVPSELAGSIAEAHVIETPASDRGSDHYPLSVTLEKNH